MQDAKVTTVKLPLELRDTALLLSEVTEMTFTQLVGAAVAQYVDRECAADSKMKTKMKERLSENIAVADERREQLQDQVARLK